MDEKRICNTCKIGKVLNGNFRRYTKPSIRYEKKCKICSYEVEKIRRKGNKDKINKRRREYRKLNINKALKQEKIYREKNRDKIRKQDKIYKEKNRNKINECSKAYSKKNRDKINKRLKKNKKLNIDKIRKQNKIYREKNRDKINKRRREYREKNRDRLRLLARKWYSKNKYKYAINRKIRRELKKKIDGYYIKEHIIITYEEFNNQCFNCKSIEKLCIDHHRPLSKGHALALDNAVILCKSCNSSKRAKDPEEFYGTKQCKQLDKRLKKIAGQYEE